MPLYNPLDSTAIIDGSVTSADIADATIAAADESPAAYAASNLYLATNYQ